MPEFYMIIARKIFSRFLGEGRLLRLCRGAFYHCIRANTSRNASFVSVTHCYRCVILKPRLTNRNPSSPPSLQCYTDRSLRPGHRALFPRVNIDTRGAVSPRPRRMRVVHFACTPHPVHDRAMRGLRASI